MILVSKVSCWRIKISFEVFVCTCLKVFNHFISNLQGNFGSQCMKNLKVNVHCTGFHRGSPLIIFESVVYKFSQREIGSQGNFQQFCQDFEW